MKTRMNQKTGTGIIVLLVATVFLTVSIVPSAMGAPPWDGSRGQRGGDKRGQRQDRAILGIWNSHQAIERLGLSEDQVQQLRDADFASREKRLALKTELDKLRLQMDKAFAQDGADQKTVRQLAQKVADTQGKMFVQKTEDRLSLESILTADQVQKMERDTRYQRRGGPGSGGRSYGKNRRGGGYGQYGGYGDGDCPRLR